MDSQSFIDHGLLHRNQKSLNRNDKMPQSDTYNRPSHGNEKRGDSKKRLSDIWRLLNTNVRRAIFLPWMQKTIEVVY